MIFRNLSDSTKSSMTATDNNAVYKYNTRTRNRTTHDVIKTNEESRISQQHANDASNDRTGGHGKSCACCNINGTEVRNEAQAHPAKDTPKAPAQQQKEPAPQPKAPTEQPAKAPTQQAQAQQTKATTDQPAKAQAQTQQTQTQEKPQPQAKITDTTQPQTQQTQAKAVLAKDLKGV